MFDKSAKKNKVVVHEVKCGGNNVDVRKDYFQNKCFCYKTSEYGDEMECANIK